MLRREKWNKDIVIVVARTCRGNRKAYQSIFITEEDCAPPRNYCRCKEEEEIVVVGAIIAKRLFYRLLVLLWVRSF